MHTFSLVKSRIVVAEFDCLVFAGGGPRWDTGSKLAQPGGELAFKGGQSAGIIDLDGFDVEDSEISIVWLFHDYLII